MIAMEEQKKDSIPYGKPARVGNFKLWRGKFVVGKGKDKAHIDCIYVSNLEGSWMVRIPATMHMYASLCDIYTMDEPSRNHMMGVLFANFLLITTSAMPEIQDALFFLTKMMTFPYLLLSESEMVKRMKKGMKEDGWHKDEIKNQVEEMVEYRRKLYDMIEDKKSRYIADYEETLAKQREKNAESLEALRQDELAEQAADIINEKSED